MFSRVLIANRGEIAVRVIRACRELGLEAVAVFSEVDRLAPHVWLADRADPIGPARAADSYLSISKLLEVAERTGCEAVHPGYGFLAENPEFALACVDRGLTFIGPPASAIELMGDKTEARRRMSEAGVPVVPGSGEALVELTEARRLCREIGYPVLLKAAAGGGGKGMRRVEAEEELESAWRSARREAEGAFSDSRVYVEKYLERPRHVEIQVLADEHGRVVHLGERECSIQRRHQKLIEESPSPAVDAELRDRMGETAVAAARSAGYVNAGTVEFLLAPDGAFYFLEMNTRIQVEHPVTELVTGVDLVQWQLRIAAGETLDLEVPVPRGHAIECRITAEDPSGNFLPATGRIEHLRAPSGPGVRWDAGILTGTEVGLHYDSLLAKLIVHAQDRPSAIDRMRRALDELLIDGVTTSTAFHRRVMEEPDFRAGSFHTGYVEEHPELLDPVVDEERLRAAAIAAVLLEEEHRRDRMVVETDGERRSGSRWRWASGGWTGRGWTGPGWGR